MLNSVDCVHPSLCLDTLCLWCTVSFSYTFISFILFTILIIHTSLLAQPLDHVLLHFTTNITCVCDKLLNPESLTPCVQWVAEESDRHSGCLLFSASFTEKKNPLWLLVWRDFWIQLLCCFCLFLLYPCYYGRRLSTCLSIISYQFETYTFRKMWTILR